MILHLSARASGKAGTWKELLTPEVVAKIDGMMTQLAGSGLDIRDS